MKAGVKKKIETMISIIAIVTVVTIVIYGMLKLYTINNSEHLERLIQGTWEGNDTQCTNGIEFKEDMSFDNWCYCGSPIGDGDLVETFKLSGNTIELYEGKDLLETANIKYIDNYYLIIDIWNKTYVYKNKEATHPKLAKEAEEIVYTNGLTRPYIKVIGYSKENNEIVVAPYDYEKDTKDKSDRFYTLEVVNNIKFKSIEVIKDNDEVEVKEDENLDVQYIGEHYTTAYLTIADNGKVEEVIFYGELISE